MSAAPDRVQQRRNARNGVAGALVILMLLGGVVWFAKSRIEGDAARRNRLEWCETEMGIERKQYLERGQLLSFTGCFYNSRGKLVKKFADQIGCETYAGEPCVRAEGTVTSSWVAASDK